MALFLITVFVPYVFVKLRDITQRLNFAEAKPHSSSFPSKFNAFLKRLLARLLRLLEKLYQVSELGNFLAFMAGRSGAKRNVAETLL
jgi:hypothetical protein